MARNISYAAPNPYVPIPGYNNPNGISEHKPVKMDVNPYGTKSPIQIFDYLLRNLEFIRNNMSEAITERKFGGDLAYYVTDEIMKRLKSTLNSGNQTQNKEKNKQNYEKYGQLYIKYNELSDIIKHKAKEVYNTAQEFFKKLRSVYQGKKNTQSTKKQPYEPRTGLVEKVVQLYDYLEKRGVKYMPLKPKYQAQVPVGYDKKGGWLEEKLAA